MAALHIRNVDDAVVDELKRRAKRNNRSLEGELRTILEKAVEGPAGSPRRRRQLRLKMVAAGSKARYGRDEIYGEEER